MNNCYPFLIPKINPRHYIEAIAILTDKNKEIRLNKFTFTNKKTKTKFKLPDGLKKYKVVTKCNIHRMFMHIESNINE